MRIKRCLFAFLSVLFLCAGVFSPVVSAEPDQSLQNGEPAAVETYALPYYEEYLAEYSGMAVNQEEISVPLDGSLELTGATKEENYKGEPGFSLITSEESRIGFTVNVPQAGLYHIKLRYIPLSGKGTSIQRALHINGEIPFSEAATFVFPRCFEDAGPIRKDSGGNDIRPTQQEVFIWKTVFLMDESGYYAEPLLFYLKAGANKLELESLHEPMAISALTLCAYTAPSSYKQVAEEYDRAGYKPAENGLFLYEGEKADYRSEASVGPIIDRTSPTTQPYSASKRRLNTVGGTRWQNAGQALTWKIKVNETGLYRLSFKVRQNVSRGSFSARRITIDGEVPFKEAAAVETAHSTDWQMVTPGADEPFLFYFEADRIYDLGLEVVLGKSAEFLRRAEAELRKLNAAYRKIIMITGVSPDPMRTYDLHKAIPQVIEDIAESGASLAEIADEMEAATKQRGSGVALLRDIKRQTAQMKNRPADIPNRLAAFRSSLGAFGAWINEAGRQPLEMDYLLISAPDEQLPGYKTGFFARIWHELQMFFYSFTEEYSVFDDITGDSDYVNDEPLRVWVTTGRDQGQTIKAILDDTFTPDKKIRTKMELVLPSALMPATVAGIGPDVVLSMGMSEPVNYALRGAVINLAEYPDFEEIASRFNEQAIIPYRFNSGVYALPETQSFMVFFYRKDIFEELELAIPDTWEDVIRMQSVLAKNNLSFAMPVSTAQAPGAGVPSFVTLLLQAGGAVYRNDGIASDLDSSNSVEAFKRWTNLYVNYRLLRDYYFVDRFRTGETPAALADYTNYNILTVSAPEIRGLWGIAPVPGTLKNCVVDRSVYGAGTSCFILSQSKMPDYGWELLKWWTNEETQSRYSHEMESLLGPSARVPTANKQALERLSWTVEDMRVLREQMSWVRCIEEVPGSYFTPRHLDNAFRKVLRSGDDPRDTLLDYVDVINRELTGKRKEFGLPTQ